MALDALYFRDNPAIFLGSGAQGKLSFTLGPATFAQLLDISAETRSLLPKNNPTLTMFPQKDFT
jgi:hypothetical protein